MEDYPLCACGCGQRVKRKGAIALKEHKDSCVNFIPLTNEHLKDPAIRQKALEHMRDSIIDAGYLSKNKNIKSNCKTLKPRRGKRRTFEDRYMHVAFTSPYNKLDFYRAAMHRLAAMLYIGEIPPDKQALHKCDVKMCCNPDHLYIGTQANNKTDYSDRRCDYKPDGNLTRHECETIRYYKEVGEHTGEEIADALNCCLKTVYNLEDKKFTTDGSEVIGKVFIPKIIPEAKKVTALKQAISLGEELMKLQHKLKIKYPNGNYLKYFEKGCIKHGVNLHNVYKYMMLYKANIHRKNYKYGRWGLYGMLKHKIDISVPF